VQVVRGDRLRRQEHRIEAPLENVAFDDQGTGDRALCIAVVPWPDIDPHRPGANGTDRLCWVEPIKAGPSGGEHPTDRTCGWDRRAVMAPVPLPARASRPNAARARPARDRRLQRGLHVEPGRRFAAGSGKRSRRRLARLAAAGIPTTATAKTRRLPHVHCAHPPDAHFRLFTY
jgi:hypothetical protein